MRFLSYLLGNLYIFPVFYLLPSIMIFSTEKRSVPYNPQVFSDINQPSHLSVPLAEKHINNGCVCIAKLL